MAQQKRLGELLVEAGLITPQQLESAITHQKIAKGRMGSNLVALGYISEDVLMDFLSAQLGVPRVDVRSLDVPLEVLKRVPRRMAEQYTILPVEVREPRNLVLAMADPMDLNAIDSARFATGLHIDPVVASHSALKAVIADQYRKVQILEPSTYTVGGPDIEEGLPVNFTFEPLEVRQSKPASSLQQSTGRAPSRVEYPPDPFFDATASPNGQAVDMTSPGVGGQPAVDPGGETSPGIITGRTLGPSTARLDGYKDHTLVLALIKLLQRRGLFSPEDLVRTVQNMIDSGEVVDERNPTGGPMY